MGQQRISAEEFIVLSITDAKEAVRACLRIGQNPILIGSPGIGKTAICYQIAEELGLKAIVLNLASRDAVDIGGFPRIGKDCTESVPIEELHAATKEPVLLVLEEIFQSDMAMQKAVGQLLLENRIGNKELHKDTRIIGSSNRMTDRSGVNSVLGHIKDRVNFVHVDTGQIEWIQYAAGNGCHPDVLAYIYTHGSSLSKFDPDKTAFPTPRTWMEVSKHLQDWEEHPVSEPVKKACLQACVGVAEGAQFVRFLKNIKNLVSIADIRKLGNRAPWPECQGEETAGSIAYGQVCLLACGADENNIDMIWKYIRRHLKDHNLTKDYASAFFKLVEIRQPMLKGSQAFAEYVSEFKSLGF
jgi:hypothetical protein